MRPSSTLAASTSVGTLVSTVKCQPLLTSRRNTLELVALKVTACSPSARSLVLMVRVSPSRLAVAVTSSPSRVTATSLSVLSPWTSRTREVDGSLT